MRPLSDVCVLLDLDGTLSDPFEGVSRCILHALHALGAYCPPADALRFCIGPPLRHSFATLLGDARSQEVEHAMRLFREHFGLSRYFDAVHGAELDGTRSEKHEVIGWLLARERIDARRCVMVGDRHHDIAGAAAHGIPAVGVSWGYGGRDELLGADAAALCDEPAALVAIVARLAARLPAG